jgi:hypothetical protein
VIVTVNQCPEDLEVEDAAKSKKIPIPLGCDGEEEIERCDGWSTRELAFRHTHATMRHGRGGGAKEVVST